MSVPNYPSNHLFLLSYVKQKQAHKNWGEILIEIGDKICSWTECELGDKGKSWELLQSF